MRKQAHELNGIPTEFHEDGAPELPVLPDEFNRFPKQQKRAADRSRRRRMMLFFAAAGLITLGVIFPKPEKQPPREASVTPAATEQPSGSQRPTTAPASHSAPDPTQVQTPEPTAEPMPAIEAILIRSSEVYYGTVLFSVPDRITEAGMRIMDPENGITAREHTFTREEIDSGEFKIEKLDAGKFFMEHLEEYGQVEHDPDFVLETMVTFRTGAGEQTLTDRIEAEVVPWVGVRFDTEEDVGGIVEMMYGTVYPNRFVVRIEEAPNDKLRVVFGDDPSALNKGDVLITITVDGTVLTGEFKPVDLFRNDFGGEPVYYYVFAVPVPDSFPEHGTAKLRIGQRLIDHDYLFEKDSSEILY